MNYQLTVALICVASIVTSQCSQDRFTLNSGAVPKNVNSHVDCNCSAIEKHNHDLEPVYIVNRLVVYFYVDDDDSNNVKIYVPGKELQKQMPRILLRASDLALINNSNVADLIKSHPDKINIYAPLNSEINNINENDHPHLDDDVSNNDSHIDEDKDTNEDLFENRSNSDENLNENASKFYESSSEIEGQSESKESNEEDNKSSNLSNEELSVESVPTELYDPQDIKKEQPKSSEEYENATSEHHEPPVVISISQSESIKDGELSDNTNLDPNPEGIDLQETQREPVISHENYDEEINNVSVQPSYSLQPEPTTFKPILATENSEIEDWFLQQTKNNNLVKKLSLKRIIQLLDKILGLSVTDEGQLHSRDGSRMDIHNINLRPVLIGSEMPIRSFLSGSRSLPSKTEYLKSLLVTRINPPKVLGMLPLGKTELSTSKEKQSSVSSGTFDDPTSSSNPKPYTTSPNILKLLAAPARTHKLITIPVNRYEVENDYPNIFDRQRRKSPKSKINGGQRIARYGDDTKPKHVHSDLQREHSTRKVRRVHGAGPNHALFSHHGSRTAQSGNERELLNDDDYDSSDDGDFRIIGGYAATGSGFPLSNRGRSGIKYWAI